MMPSCGSDSPISAASPHSSYSEELVNRTNVYIRKLSPEATDKDLLAICEEFGTIVSTKAIIDVETNTCKGYGFVDFESPQSAALAIRSLPAKGYQAQIANLQELDPTNLYVGNLPAYITERDLDSLFSPFGRVISTRILRTSVGMSKRMGFARMESHDKCEAVISAFNGKFIPGSSSDAKEPLVVKYADVGKRKLIPLKLTIDKAISQVLQQQQTPLMSPNCEPYTPYFNSISQPPPTGLQSLQQSPFTVSTSPFTNFPFPVNTNWMQPILVQAPVPTNQFATPMPGYYSAVAYQLPQDAPLMPAVTLDSTFSGMTYYPSIPGTCADGRFFFCGPQLVK